MDLFFGLDSPSLKDKGISLLTTVTDTVSADITEEILRDAGIATLRRERGAGGLVQIIAGSFTGAIDIYVATGNLEEAKAILAAPAEPTDDEKEIPQ